MTVDKLHRSFYERDTLTVAKELLGKYMVYRTKGIEYVMLITDVEAYTGIEDKACHTYGGKRTPRTEAMWGPAGHAYIYLIYGMYACMNVVTEGEGNPCAVLIRGAVPVTSREAMSQNRYGKAYKDLSSYQKRHFSNGPGKLCMALGLSREQNGVDLQSDGFYIRDSGDNRNYTVHEGKRINIDYAEEAVDYLYRFYIDEPLHHLCHE